MRGRFESLVGFRAMLFTRYAKRRMSGAFTGPGALRATHRVVPIEAWKGESGTVEDTNNGGDVDLAGRGTERITPVRPSTTREQPAAGELPQNGIQETPRNPLTGRDFCGQDGLSLGRTGQLEQRPEGIDGFSSDHKSTNAIEIVPNLTPGTCQATKRLLSCETAKGLSALARMRLQGRS